MKLFSPVLTLAIAGGANGIKFFTTTKDSNKRGLRVTTKEEDHIITSARYHRNLEELPLTYIGNNGDDVFPLGICEADCDNDDDCDVCI